MKRSTIVKTASILVASILLSFLIFEYMGLFRTANWGKYYIQRLSWEEIIADPSSHIEPVTAFFGILVVVLLLFLLFPKSRFLGLTSSSSGRTKTARHSTKR